MNNRKNEKKVEKIAKIVIDRNLCIGAAACIALAPETFGLDEKNIAIIKNPQGNSDKEILQAAQACPTAAIFLYDKDNNLIYPEEI